MNKGYIQLINHRRKSGIMLYKSGNVVMRGNQFKVKSESDSSIEYDTSLDSCSCPDYQNRRLQSKSEIIMNCKHINALLLQLGLENEDTFILEQEVV